MGKEKEYLEPLMDFLNYKFEDEKKEQAFLQEFIEAIGKALKLKIQQNNTSLQEWFTNYDQESTVYDILRGIYFDYAANEEKNLPHPVLPYWQRILSSVFDDIIKGESFIDIFKSDSGKLILNCYPYMSRGATIAADSVDSTNYLTASETDDVIGALICHMLWEGLRRDGKKRIKKCPYCHKYFCAINAKRSFCYSNLCLRESKRIQKQHQREVNPVKYI